ncbi:hypothetical protein JTE90_013292 [Oedothorax gibbosus]|uniref:C2H2-type domain-containing protein n=1 Tax=Oedothorax gibbosus TaxID=931172 RepID=A0AAV6VD38_9ARAC|nr:hypothetical protein JTE90_013292 [Oedothorax gibbosus]
MPPKRGVKTIQKGKVAPKATRAGKAAPVKQVEIKKKGRPAKAKKEPTAPITIEDIVKDKKFSTCDECGGVWFSKELFDKHLLSCGVPKVVANNVISTQATEGNKRKPNDEDLDIEEIPIVNGTTTNGGTLPLKKKKPNEEEAITLDAEVEIIKNFSKKTENTAGLQSLMSNKVQSLLFASKSQPKPITESQSSNNFASKDAVSISASNLRKNIASTMQKIAPVAVLRPTRSSGPIPEVTVLSAKAGMQNKAAAKKTASFNSVEAVAKVKGNLIGKGTDNNTASQVSPLRSGRGRKPQQKPNQTGNSPSDAITILDPIPNPEEEVITGKETPATRGRGRKRQQDPVPSETLKVPETPKKSDVLPLKRGRGRPKVVGNKKVDDVVENSRVQKGKADSSDVDNIKVVETKSGRGRRALNSEVEDSGEKQQIKEEADEESEEKSALHSIIFGTKSTVAPKPGTSSDPSDPDAITFNCAVCHKAFTRKYHLDRHLRISRCSGLPLPSFPCELCNRVYTRKDNLREHLRSHTGEVHRRKNHKCPYCDKAFHGQSLLAIHVRKHTGEKPFSCDFCPKKFPSTGALSKHRMTHTGEKPYSCNECGRRFTLKGTLSRHLRTHTGIRPHTCTFCGKKFIQIGGLNAHMFYHTGENGFRCEDCGKVFNRKARLQMHQLYVHIKLKPFVCEHCSKPFTRKEDLMRHAVLHTGEKPFKCPTCDRCFSVKPSLKLHLLTHTKEEPRSCHECGRAFIRKDCLLRHMRKRHRDVFDKLFFDEKDEKDSSIVNTRVLSEKDLTENIRELLYLLIDEPTLVGFGWPDKPVDEVLELVIQRCGHTPVSKDLYSYMDRLRENAKLLFTVVIDDNAVKTLLNNQTVDEVILHVLRLAKT